MKMLDNILKIIVNRINRKEYLRPPFSGFTERPVEYHFVFSQLATYYPKTVLDVGTGLTALPHLIANCGFKVTAIDNIKDYWESGMWNRHYYVINDDIKETKLTEKFDMVTCISVLEHINEPDKAIRNMFKLLNPKGRLVLTFPYNEKQSVENVYKLQGSEVKKLLNYQTAAYSRKDLDRWQKQNQAIIKNQEYWQFYEGDYWTIGNKVIPPKKVSKKDKHQITCLVFEKN